jgi:hypothetical protein
MAFEIRKGLEFFLQKFGNKISQSPSFSSYGFFLAPLLLVLTKHL